ncbi:MAG TPA: ABC transporter substrate-binding protein [Stellaceae bacterium]|jgi:NitT/TauT family transport system substrate-binding protein
MPAVTRLRLFENYRFVLYAPFYAAHATGAYEAEGLEVELLPSPGPGKAEAAVLAGEADVMWMGPIRIMKLHEQNPTCPLTAFAEVVTRDPFSLLGGKPNPGFKLADLAHIRFASVSEVPTPWLCITEDIRQAGLDPNRLDRIADKGMPENVAALHAGTLPVAQMFEPFVEQAIRGGAHVWQQSSARGLTSYTVFATHRDRLAQNPEPFRRMVRAMARTQRWVAAASPSELAAAIGSYFPDLDRAVLEGSLARYKSQGVWATDPRLPEEGFLCLQRALLSSGFLSHPVPYADCVDSTLIV